MWVSASGVTSGVSDVSGQTVEVYYPGLVLPSVGMVSTSPVPICCGGLSWRARSNHPDAVKEGLIILPSDPDVRSA